MGGRWTVETGLVEARFWRREDGRVHCYLCARHCRIPEGGIGFCGVRKVVNGRLYALNYGRIVTLNVDPIEKKPLSHFMPGTLVASIATAGCNYACQYCQNWDISQRRRVEEPYTPPEYVVEEAIRRGASGISYTYNEPTIFAEYAMDVMALAHSRGLFNTWVTNGYMTVEALGEISRDLDAATVDFKGHGDRAFYRKYIWVKDAEDIFESLREMRRRGIFIEVTDLVVPVKEGLREESFERLVRFVHDELGPETPLHFLRFHPDYRMMDVPHTPVELLEKYVERARSMGLHHVYIGNVWGHPYEDTYCPGCGYKVVDRYGFYITRFELDRDGRCPRCGYKLNFVLRWRDVEAPVLIDTGS